MTTLAKDAPKASPAKKAVPTSIRTLLVHVSPDAHAAPRLASAVALARKLDATLFGLAAEMIPPLGAMDPTGLVEGEWFLEMRGQVQRNLELARETFRAAAKGVKTDFAWIEDMPAPALARASRAADLILVGGQPLGQDDRYRTCKAAEAMLLSGRPVLIAPPEGGELKAKAVVVAWKDSRESRRALADALPLLALAEAVLVMEVCGKDEAGDADQRTKSVVAGLQRHDIKAQAGVVVAPIERVATELHVAAQAIGADLIVAGGYGHTRLGEWIFGGVTRDLLNNPERFVLLSH
ncbi:universal stress protein [Phenylobacterium sp. LjRoot225]|uniref:universal stress protein n=1 Tax=Phenylobacterium sp. LjRoot225 TaxID=3342285 RepID=UPI003ECECA9B